MFINKFILFYLFFSIYRIYGQDKLRPMSLSFYIRNFKHDRNNDFDIPLSNTFFVEGIMDETLPADKKPKYCCGENSFYDEDGVLLVNNEDTFNQWFNSDGSCNNYLSTYTVAIEEWDDANFATGMVDDFNPFDGSGYDNVTEFPEYESDPYNKFFCYELHFTAIANQFASTFAVRSPGETWVYVNNHLYIDEGGYSEGWFDFPKVIFGTAQPQLEYGVEYPIDVYSCSREMPTRIDQLFFELYGYELDIFCSWVDDNGVCNGDNFDLQCIDNTISCSQNKLECGVCKSIDRTCDETPITTCTYPICLEGSGCIVENVNCDDFDPCTIDSCDETVGCFYTNIPNCRCNSTNCITEDECFPKVCLDDDTCLETLRDCSLELPECTLTSCQEGYCICLDVSTTTIGVTTTSTTSNPTISTTGFPTTTSTTSTTSATSTTGIPTSTTSTTGIPPSTTSTTGAPSTTTTTSTTSIITSTTSTTGIQSTISTTNIITTGGSSTFGSTRPPIDETKCNKFSCPYDYDCIQLTKSFTCVSKHFCRYCYQEIDKLKIFY